MADIRRKALAKLANPEDLSDEDYFELLKQKKQERIGRAIAGQEDPDYFEDVDEAEMEVSDLIDEEIPLEEQERMARELLRRKRLGLE